MHGHAEHQHHQQVEDELGILLVSKSSDGILWVRRSNDAAAGRTPILTNLDQNDCLVEVLVDKIPMGSGPL